jgi:hypothetical protein
MTFSCRDLVQELQSQSCHLNTKFNAWFRHIQKNGDSDETFLCRGCYDSRSTRWLLNIKPTGDVKMTFFKMAAATALLALMPMTALAAEMPSAEQCSGWFMKADTNNDGALGQQEDASKFAGMISKSSVADKNNSTSADALILQKDVFMKYCGEGTFGMPSN